MAIPNGVIFMWGGTNASIPSGWSRVTDLDNKFPRVIDTGDTINATGGSATHTHTSPSHFHNLQEHSHTFSLSGVAGNTSTGGNGSQPGIRSSHSHGVTTSGGVTTYASSSVTVTYSAVSNNPPFYEVIFITPTTIQGALPADTITFMEGTDPKTFSVCDGTNSTPNLVGKFLKGAPTSGNGGGTGGSTTNSHTIDHTHTHTHGHIAVYTAGADSYVGINTGGEAARNGHNHLVGLSTETLTSNTNSAISAQAETVIPPYVDLLIVQNKTGGLTMTPGVIGMWLGLEANIPKNWEIQTKYGRLLRGSNVASVGNTGGSATHSHGAQSHSHTTSGHQHYTGDIYHIADVRDSTGDTTYTRDVSYHPSQWSSITAPSLESSTTTADTANNMPEYRNVALIKYKGEKGGAFLFNML